MKKTILTAIVFCALTLSLAGCGAKNNSSSSDSSATSGATSAPEFDSETSAPESDSESSASAETAESQPDSGKADILGAAALNADEWPELDIISDPEVIEAYFGFKIDDAEDYYLAMPMISANVEEIVVVKPKAGSEEVIRAAVEDHISNVTENMFLYPGQEEIAAGAVTGVTADGYCYGIIHKNGEGIAQAINAAE